MKKIKYADNKLIEKFEVSFGFLADPEDPLFTAGYETEELENGEIKFYQITALIEDVEIFFSDQPIQLSKWQYDLNEITLIGNETYIKFSEVNNLDKSMNCLFRKLSSLIENYICEEKITPEIFIEKSHKFYKDHLSKFLLNN